MPKGVVKRLTQHPAKANYSSKQLLIGSLPEAYGVNLFF